MPLFCKQGAYGPVFARSRLVLNQSAAGELNFRLFQAMACGAAVLTEDTENGLADLFTPGHDVLTYRRGDAGHAAAVAQKALENPDALAELAAAGKRNVLANHTIVQRARHIVALAEELAASGAPARRLARAAAVEASLRKAYAMLATDEQLPLPSAVREMYLQLAGGLPGRPV
jgi:tryptophan 2,3-dioxygenase